MAQAADTPIYASVEALIAGETGGIHIECAQGPTQEAVRAVRDHHRERRCAFYVATDGGFERETVLSYLRFFKRLAGRGTSIDTVLERFGLQDHRRRFVRKLNAEQVALLNIARLALFEPEVCFCERPLNALGADARSMVLGWMNEAAVGGTVFVTAGQPLREALLMPGTAFWDDDGHYVAAAVAVESDGEDAVAEDGDALFAGDEVRVCKIPAKADAATLLFDPREIDFIESMNKANYVSVRGELYATHLTMDELDGELARFGFFRCHRSYIVNVQKVAKVERYTRNAFNLTLSDTARTSIPLAKGRADAMLERYGWR